MLGVHPGAGTVGRGGGVGERKVWGGGSTIRRIRYRQAGERGGRGGGLNHSRICVFKSE